jgi:hypothetical protein
MAKCVARRWGDNDTYIGPFTFARDRRYKHLGVSLTSTDDEDRGCSLRISGFGMTFIVALPSWVLRPERKKVFPTGWDAATIKRLGRDWYWDITQREFGWSLSDGHLSISYGRRTHDSSTEQRWGCFLPWTQWRHVRHSLYALDGRLYAHLPQNIRWDSPQRDAEDALRDSCPTQTFAFNDFDGEALTATTRIEEREWRFGTGYFKWLSLFVPNKIRRSLDIRFSGETGARKGSWKGGTIGHGIDMEVHDSPTSAFVRYCAEHDMTLTAVMDPRPVTKVGSGVAAETRPVKSI